MQRPPRRRARETRPDQEALPTAEAGGPPIETVAAVPTPAGPTTGRRQWEPSEQSVVEQDTRPKLAADDLQAIAQMDRAELAALMNDVVPTRRRLEPGARVAGTISRVGRDTVFVEVGGKSEGQLERGELPEAEVGASITAFVVGEDEAGTVLLSMSLSGQAAAEHLEEARLSKLPVEGKVVSRNTGGFEVRIGSARAFCPVSLISRIPEVDLDGYLGQTLAFRVIETGDKTVVNRRVLQEEEAETKAAAIWTTLAVGQQHRGIVRSVQPFGMFVDIGGVDGLVPKREISWRSHDDPRAAARVGQAVEVVILEMDDVRRKLTLSAKALEDDPWGAVDQAFTEGGSYNGVVVGTEPFGAFVELAPGLAGLVHISKLPGGLPQVGATVQVRLMAIDRERKRLELAIVQEGGPAVDADRVVRGVTAEVTANGVIVQLDDGRTGWLPESEVDLPSGTVLSQRFRKGKPVEARILRDDPRRPTLSCREAKNDDLAWRAHQAKPSGGASFGTFGDILGNLNLKR